MQYQKNALLVKLFSIAVKFSIWLQDIPNKITPPPFRLLQLGSAFWQSRVLYVAARLDIAGVLADEALHVKDLATMLATHPDATYRMLRMLSAMGIFEETSPRTFKNNKLSACLREDDPQSVRAMILMHNSEEMSRPWYEQLEQGIKNGQAPFKLTHDEELFVYMADHADFSSRFAKAMDSVEALSGDSFATDFNWTRFERIIDIGGSKGSKSLAILKRHPQLKALVIDQAQVINEARHHWQGKEDETLLARLAFQAGDVLESVPKASSDKDIYFLSAVLHGFDDKSCIRALRNVAAASADSGAPIALLELVMDESKPDFAGTAFDMQMFMGTAGRERTLPEWETLFSKSSVKLEEAISLRSFGNILFLRPRY